ncbi:MAG: tetratricopeptide repeat protein [Crocinitomicaceae bacterium]|nr:tetratricopeptide repeat protein [Flavobacteriales bacterium]NQZ38259.1 tetratricopeptide repeat protein [Crocinitomicaceae bacterium]
MKLFILVLLLVFNTPTLSAQRGLMKRADKAHFIEEDYEKSLKLFRKAAKSNPDNEMTLNGVGIALYRLGRLEEAIGCFDQAVAINPDQLTLYYNRANALQAIGKNMEALNDINFAIKNAPKKASYLNSRGVIHIALEDYESAILDCSQAIELEANFAKSYINRGLSYFRIKKYASAESDYLKAISIDTTFATAYINYGHLLYKNNQQEEAIPYLKKSLSIGCEKYHALWMLWMLAGCYESMEQYDLCENYYSEAIEMDTVYSNSYFKRGTSRAHRQDYEGALEDFNFALRLDSLHSGALTNRALLVNEKLGKFDIAIADIEKVIQIKIQAGQEAPFAYNNLGYILFKMNKLKEAQENVEFSIDLDSLNSYAFRNLALIYRAQGKQQLACVSAKKAISLGFIEQYGDGIIELKNEVCK